jgi:hypothetical protein
MMEQGLINPPPPPSTPQRAPWGDVRELIRLMTTLINIYESRALAAGGPTMIQISEEGVTPVAGGATQVAVSVDSKIQTPWVQRNPAEILSANPTATGIVKSGMYNWGSGKRLLLWLESSLDQDVVVQAKGNIYPNIENATNIGPSIALISHGVSDIGLAWDDWHPYVGVEITITTAPTEGEIKTYAVEQV